MARLLAVNVGLPQDIHWRDETVHPGIWRARGASPRSWPIVTPIAPPVMMLNERGLGQSAHERTDCLSILANCAKTATCLRGLRTRHRGGGLVSV